MICPNPASLTGGSFHPASQSTTTNSAAGGGPQHTSETTMENGQEKARVICDYDARDPTELSLMQDEVICVTEIPGDEDYLLGIRGSQRGKVPKAFLESLGQR